MARLPVSLADKGLYVAATFTGPLDMVKVVVALFASARVTLLPLPTIHLSNTIASGGESAVRVTLVPSAASLISVPHAVALPFVTMMALASNSR